MQPTRTPAPERAGRVASPAVSLFGFAPGGVCRAACVTARAVGFYPTVSPLPRQNREALPGGLFSVALSLGSPPPAVNRRRFSVEPGLSSHAAFRPLTCAAARPAGAAVKPRSAAKRNRKDYALTPMTRFTLEQYRAEVGFIRLAP